VVASERPSATVSARQRLVERLELVPRLWPPDDGLLFENESRTRSMRLRLVEVLGFEPVDFDNVWFRGWPLPRTCPAGPSDSRVWSVSPMGKAFLCEESDT
jgi:hypothetical protein